jgi:hypothetical protein
MSSQNNPFYIKDDEKYILAYDSVVFGKSSLKIEKFIMKIINDLNKYFSSENNVKMNRLVTILRIDEPPMPC